MKIEEFIECTIDELIAAKRNSFSRNIVAQHKDIQRHEELAAFANDGLNGQLATYLFVCKNLTIHAIDENQAPIPFYILDSIYGDAVFVLQYLPKKKVYALTLFRNSEKSEDFVSFFSHTYYSGSNAFKADRNTEIFESFLDFGLVKCAMSLNKDYGIQDILELAWKKLCSSDKTTYSMKYNNKKHSGLPKAARFLFNVEHPELSVLTLYGDNDLNLFGSSKIIDSNISQISEAISFLDKKYNIIMKGNH